MNIMDQIEMYGIIYPDKSAIKTENEIVTYGELLKNVRKVTNGILDLIGNGKNGRIAILMSNSIEFIEIYLASIRLGKLVVPMDFKWSAKQNSYVLEKYKPSILFLQETFHDHIDRNKQDSKCLVIECSSEYNGKYQQWRESCSDKKADVGNDNENMLIAFTSGTTGNPKGYYRTHSSWFESFYAANSEFDMNSNDFVMAPGPFVHSLSLFAMTHCLFLGGTFLLIDKYAPEKVVSLLKDSQNIVIYMVPTMIQSLLKYIKDSGYQRNRFSVKSIITSGDKCRAELKKELCSVFQDVKVYEFYGSSETSYISVLAPQENVWKPNSIGHVCKNVSVSIRDEDGNELGANQVGKIFVKSKMIFKGYYDDEEETKKVYHDDWFEMGDYGLIDEDGYINIKGREKNMLISGGLNIYPEEIEKVLKFMTEIEEAVVIGRPSEYWGQEVIAYIKFKYGKKIEPEEIKRYCSQNLPTYKCPHEFIEVEEFVYTSTGKINRVEVHKL